ncbi:MAG: hypothetical protein R2754_05610 [Microthrixaceae bacterium]
MLLSLLKMVAPYLAGGGPAGMVARQAVDWLQERLEEPDEERVSTARLAPGDRVEIVARPAPTKAERRVEAQLDAASTRLDKLRAVSPKQVKVAASLATTQKKLDKAGARPRARKLRVREQNLLAQFDRLDSRRSDRRSAEQEVDRLKAELEAMRAASLAAAGGSGTRKRTFYRADD